MFSRQSPLGELTIHYQFIPYGATLTNLFVKDKNGEDIDVVLGYDDVDYYR
jgi:hypothetical protein